MFNPCVKTAVLPTTWIWCLFNMFITRLYNQISRVFTTHIYTPKLSIFNLLTALFYTKPTPPTRAITNLYNLVVGDIL